jgi:DNA-binding transcriptional MerR regulator
VGERSYLAIGDVLALLREEFPDVTISKIRFLESRGLLDPERTPSGYRKFYEPDVDRLRWILRQQREHFLPLKVIKGRLENGMTDPDAPTPHLFEMGDPPPERTAQPVLVGVPGAPNGALERAAQAAVAALPPMAVVSAPDRAPRRAGLRAGQTVLAEAQPPAFQPPAPEPDPITKDRDESGGTRPAHSERPVEVVAATSAGGAPTSRRRRSASTVPPGARAEPAASTPGPAASGEAGESESPQAAVPARHLVTRSTAGLPGSGLSGASLTLVELASASGLETAGVEELESFGLIAGRTVAGVHCYGEEAVLVAKLAARFAPYGIEARHLKVFKHAADRQTGLFAQVVTPLLRQRNPEARARAIAELAELAELGEALMGCFTQATLRELTGG